MTVVGELIAGRYEIDKLVGSGGMSNVFRAHDRLLERTVALKILHEQYTRDDDYVERFRREARAVAQLTHPNIVTVIDRGEQEGRQFIVFEYVEGHNLKELTANGPLEVHDAIVYSLQVAHALAFAHERGLVHRDVKPQNVLVNEEGQAKVTDFGIARSLDVHGVTQTGTVLGTSDYIAPEQAQGRHVDPRTDIYSLGVVLYELLTGEVPFRGDNFVAVAMRHVNEPAPSVLERRPDCPLRLELAVGRAMAKDPVERFESMGELSAELDACLAEVDGRSDGGATMIIPPQPRPRRRRAPRSKRHVPVVPLLLVLAIAVAIAGGAALLLRDGGGGGVLPAIGATPSKPVALTGVATDDPAQDGEHDDEVGRATDGNPGTYWTTQDYGTFDKPGVGIVFDAGRPVALASMTVQSDLADFPATIRASTRSTGGFVPVSGKQEVGERTRFRVDTDGKGYRYYEIWLQLPNGGRAHVNEVTART